MVISWNDRKKGHESCLVLKWVHFLAMVDSLHSLFQSLAMAQTEQELLLQFMDQISEPFGVQRWGIYILNEQNHLAGFEVHGVSDAFVERYEQIGRSVDPILSYVLQHHIPAHEELVLPVGEWKQSELYQRCCAEYEHEHIMTGPIVGQGRLVGTVQFARVGSTPAFNTNDLMRLSAVCTHLSACLAALRRTESCSPNSCATRLTPRELEIAHLVAKGFTNAEIGAELWITQNSVKQALKRMFRKLNVSARTELVAKLYD